jgi:hypothetical protein
MLLRRIKVHVDEQNWFAVLLDFVIVVVGIFVGLQVDNWNEDRKTRAEEQRYLVRLSEDAAGSLEQGRFMRNFIVDSADRAEIVLRALDDCALDPGDRVDFANGLYHLAKLFPPYMVRGTIDELTSTGKLAILRNTELRDQLNLTIREFERFSLIFDDAEARTQPHVAYVDSIVVYRISEPQSGDTEIGWNDIDLDLDAVCHDRRFYTAVSAARNYAYDVASWHDTTMRVIDEFKTAVDAELREAY